MLKKILFPLVLILAVASCAPPAVPAGASVHWDKEWGFYWTWTRRSQHGCADWTATKDWASVDLRIDTQCGIPPSRPAVREGINYASSRDDIALLDWRTSEMAARDTCPRQIQDTQIAELRRASVEAMKQAETQGERRVLDRIDGRLQVLSGVERTDYPGGFRCSLIQVGSATATAPEQDPWNDGR